MKYIKEFRKHNYEKEHLITEDTEFFQYQFSQNTPNPLGPTHGFATDPSLSIYTGQDSPYTDHYSRTIGLMNDLKGLIDHFNKNSNGYTVQKYDHFTEDIDNYNNLKILRMFENQSNYLDIYISFEFDEKEYFGVFKNYNKAYEKPKLKCELFKSPEYMYIDEEYILKLTNFFRKILNNWFIPKKGNWKNLKDGLIVNNIMGEKKPIKKNKVVDLKGYNIDENNNPYLILEFDNDEYYLKGNSYYWFQWFFEKF